MTNTQELSLFFPLQSLNSQGWLNDFILPQLMRNKTSVPYSLIFNNYNNIPTQETADSIKTIFTEQKLFNDFLEANKRKEQNEEKFIYLNGRYADILENNICTRNMARASVEDSRQYLTFLNSIQPFQMAFIQPYMRLYYGWKNDPNNKKEKFKFIEFPFSQKFETNELLNNPTAYFEGSGIKSVTNDVQFNLGTKRNCKINISYFFSNMNVLTEKINVPNISEQPKYGFSFMKIMSNTSIKKEILKLEYGYYVDPTLESQHQISPYICNMINTREVKTFGLHKTGHNFKFNKEGGVEISVDYINIAEAFFESDTNVSIPSAESKANVRIINEVESKSQGALSLLKEYELIKKEAKVARDKIEELLIQQTKEPETINKTKTQREDLNRLKQKKIQTLREKETELNKTLSLIKRQMIPYFRNILVDTMQNNFDLYSISFNTKKNQNNYSFTSTLNLVSPNIVKNDNNNIVQSGKEIKICDLSSNVYNLNDFFTKDSYPESVRQKMSGILNRMFNTPIGQINSNSSSNHIVFFPLRALIRALYQMLNEEDEKPLIPHILFGNLSTRMYDKIYNINCGNVLIELNTFQKWMHQNFYSRGQFDFSFGEIVKKIVDDLVPEALYRNKTYPNNTNRITVQDYVPTSFIRKNWNVAGFKYNLEHSEINEAYMKQLSESIYNHYYNDADAEPLIIFSKLDVATFRTTTANNYSVSSNKELNLNESEDASRGIPYIVIGADRGMFISADFSQIDQKNLRSGIALQAMTDENSNYFFHRYGLSAEVFGSSIFNHGSIVCIPTPPLALANAEYDLGIVGYYKVLGLRDTIDANGNYKSNISATWFYDGGRGGKNGKPILENPIKPLKISEIFDYVPKESYDPKSYINLLVKTDIKVLTNFGMSSKDQTPKTKQPKQKKEKNLPTPRDSEETDVSSNKAKSVPKTSSGNPKQ